MTLQSAYRVGLWKGIKRGWDCFIPFISFLVGNEDRVKFWSDLWCGDLPLKGVFLHLFSIVANREAVVTDYIMVRNGNLHWEVTFVRNLLDWKIEPLLFSLDLIYSVSPNDNGVDQMCWQRDSNKAFTVRSYYSCLNVPSPQQFPWKGIWKSKAPPRVAFFVWMVAWGKILTNDNLRKRRIILVDWCCLCKNAGESSDHLFLHCSMAKQLWDSILTLFGMHWVMPRTTQDLIACSSGALGKNRQAVIWRTIPHCIMWCIWRDKRCIHLSYN